MIKNKIFKRMIPLILLLALVSLLLYLFFTFKSSDWELMKDSLPSNQTPPSLEIYELPKQTSERTQNSMDSASNNNTNITEPTFSNSTMDSSDSYGQNNPHRITYQPDFYYEPLSTDTKEKITGISYKENPTISYDDLSYVSILHVDFNGETQVGELICNTKIAQDFVEIFYELYLANYAIDKIRLIDEYDANDDLSCLDNNTSCFNYRTVGDTNKLSNHALGVAIDINPVYNPYVTYPQGQIRITPPGSEIYEDRTKDFPHKIDESDLCYQLFTDYGFTWGGNWKNIKDYQHFEKKLE